MCLCGKIGLLKRVVNILHLLPYLYSLPTKLREGNVFTGVCHSVHRGVGPYPHNQPLPSPLRTIPPSPRTVD